jgi:voltage-gated potassium channel
MVHRPRRFLSANLRYLWALLGRFRFTVVMAGVLFLLAPFAFRWLYVGPDGQGVGYGQALHHVYFLLYGQPSLPYVDSLPIEALNLLIPPVGIAVVVDGIVRFSYLYFAKHRSDKEWISVISQAFKDHIIVCGAGRVGYRVANELLQLQRDVIVIDRKEDAAFVGVLRDRGVPVLIDDIKSPQCLSRTNVATASALVCATDDDLANLNVALDARRLNPDIRLVLRLFDDDLVAKVRDAFRAEALSSSALAGPAMALAALDPRIQHSFHVGGHLMVVSQFVAGTGLRERCIGDIRQDQGAVVLAMKRGAGPETLHPRNDLKIASEDVLTVQAEYGDYLKLRELTNEARPPVAPLAARQ